MMGTWKIVSLAQLQIKDTQSQEQQQPADHSGGTRVYVQRPREETLDMERKCIKFVSVAAVHFSSVSLQCWEWTHLSSAWRSRLIILLRY